MSWAYAALIGSVRSMSELADDNPALDRPKITAATPRVQELLEANEELSDRLGAARRVENIRRSVASEDERVIVEMNPLQKLSGMLLAEDVYTKYTPSELAAVITETAHSAGQLASAAADEVRAQYFPPPEEQKR
ncbi:Uncharacterised protein [Mycobacteroides abscessus subsp. massiliense]|nr:Uncharacterised protein [Mycobacteroides abscessus subsp. abscessus]SKT82884.1 Uncharacterised protein [Mycobacteroides abscessus subsp. massiliense]SKT97706.1 Uncharacterised protein [Mycobacteroides abscessus subsp. massiliense]